MENRKCFVLILYSLAQCLYWACGCAAISFSVVYLTSKGFSQAETGMICSAAAALSFFLTGRMACVLDAKKAGPLPVGVGLFSVIALSLAAANFITHAGLITATLYTLAVAGLQSAIFYYNELYAGFSHQGIFLNFGAARALGSVSFSAASTLLGILIQRHGAGFLPAIACILAILQIVCMLVLCRISLAPTQTETVPPTSRTSVLRFLRQHRRFARFLLGASLVSAGNLTLTTFLIHIVERAGGSPGTLGALNAYMALIEIPVMFCYARIRKKYSPRTLVRIGTVFYVLKILGFSVSASLPILFLAATMHAFSFGLFTPASVDYVIECIPPGDSAKGQGLMVSTPVLLSCVTLAAFGALLDLFGLVPVLMVFCVLSLLGMILALRSL